MYQQAVHAELASMSSQKDQSVRSMRECEARASTAEQRANMVTAERNDILNNYKKILSELRSCEERLHEVRNSYSRFYICMSIYPF